MIPHYVMILVLYSIILSFHITLIIGIALYHTKEYIVASCCIALRVIMFHHVFTPYRILCDSMFHTVSFVDNNLLCHISTSYHSITWCRIIRSIILDSSIPTLMNPDDILGFNSVLILVYVFLHVLLLRSISDVHTCFSFYPCYTYLYII